MMGAGAAVHPARCWPGPAGYEVSTDPERLDIDRIHRFVSSAYWSPGVPRDVVERAIAHTSRPRTAAAASGSSSSPVCAATPSSRDSAAGPWPRPTRMASTRSSASVRHRTRAVTCTSSGRPRSSGPKGYASPMAMPVVDVEVAARAIDARARAREARKRAVRLRERGADWFAQVQDDLARAQEARSCGRWTVHRSAGLAGPEALRELDDEPFGTAHVAEAKAGSVVTDVADGVKALVAQSGDDRVDV